MEIPGILQYLLPGHPGSYVSSNQVRGDFQRAPHPYYPHADMYHVPRNHLSTALHHHNHGGGVDEANNSYEDDIPPVAVGGSAEGDDLDHEKLKDISRLPTASRIEEIITSLKVFNIKSAMPPKLIFTETAEDVALQDNVTMLFSDAVCDRLRLIESLKLVLLTENSLMSESQKRNIRKQKEKKLDTNQKEDIKKFYPCLVALMNVLLIRCDAKAQQNTTADASVGHILLVLWRNVMSKLSEIFTVIVYGKDQGLIDLGTYPTNWDEIIKENNRIIQSVTISSRELNDKIFELNQKKNEGDRQIEEIHAKYADVISRLKLRESELTGVQHLLDSLTQVVEMVKKNKKYIEDLQR
jgi:hypothetical protein